VERRGEGRGRGRSARAPFPPALRTRPVRQKWKHVVLCSMTGFSAVLSSP